MFLISISSTISPPSGFAMTISSVPVICIVYWLIILGKQLGVFQLFIISIYTDFLMGTPVGSYLLLFSMLRFITIVVRNKFEIDTFFKNILAAIILIIAFYVCNIFFFMIYHSKLLLTDFYILNMLATIFLYPLLAVIF
ncbi:MAG: hypothetical protein VX089_00680, partial [Pseudomonadota bacterium]|nr:hypothetical protein [Pseudomonadota bacterium]